MKYSVVLQDPFDFAPFWLYLGIGLLVAAAAAWYALRRLKDAGPARRGGPHPIRAVRLFFLKISYLRMLRRIERDYKANRIDGREAHQRMSRVVRLFAQAATGLPVTRMVLSELPPLFYSQLTDVIGGLYEPEFSPQSREEIGTMILQSKELVRQWK